MTWCKITGQVLHNKPHLCQYSFSNYFHCKEIKPAKQGKLLSFTFSLSAVRILSYKILLWRWNWQICRIEKFWWHQTLSKFCWTCTIALLEEPYKLFFWWLLDGLECSADTLHHQGVNPDLNYLCKLWMCSQLNCIIFFSTKLVMLWNRHSVSIDYKFRKGLLMFWLSRWELFWKEYLL